MSQREDKVLEKLFKDLEEFQKVLAEKNKENAKLTKQRDDLSKFNVQEIEALRGKYQQELAEAKKEISVLESKISQLVSKIEAFASPPTQIGKLICLTGKDKVIILDNSKRTWEVLLDPELNPENLREGDEVKYFTNEFGAPVMVFAVSEPTRKEEEIVIIKELVENDERALIVLPGDIIKIANISKKAKGTLEKGDEVFYNLTINFIIEKVPKTAEKVDLRKVVKKTYSDIGGLEEEIRKIREVVEIPLKHPELFEKLGISPPKGILLTGPPGCGKTLIGQAVANETEAFFIHVSGPEIMNPYIGEPESKLRTIFEAARRYAPAIIFLDEIEAIAQKREEMHVGQMVEQRIVAQLLSLMDGLISREKVVVIAATNVPDLLDPALRRPGRFDREIVIHIPDRNDRLEILKIHSKNIPLGDDVNLEDMADRTHGFTGADLEALCKEAVMSILKNIKIEDIESISAEEIRITNHHFESVLKEMKPSLLREVAIQRPIETWADVGGLDEIKRELEEAILWPLKYPELLKVANHKPTKGILLFGPPGCGKTLVARALANEAGVNFIAVKGPELIAKWVGTSEENIRKIFKRARQAVPSILFFDEIEALVSMRGSHSGDAGVSDKVTSQLLTELDGIEPLNGVFVLAATNRIDLVDDALLRPGRFDRVIYLPAPNELVRKIIFEIHTRGTPLAEDVDLSELAKKAVLPAGTAIAPGITLKREASFTGAVIAALCQRATQKALTEFVATRDPKNDYPDFKVCMKHFTGAFEEMMPTVKIIAKEGVSGEEKNWPSAKDIPEISEEDFNDAL